MTNQVHVSPRASIPAEIARKGEYWIGRKGDVVSLCGPHGMYVKSSEDYADWVRARASALRGHVLSVGLGLGLCLRPIREIKAVTGISVLERAPEVAELFEKSPWHDADVKIHVGDFWTFNPPRLSEKYDSIFVDIHGETDLDGTANPGPSNSARELDTADGVQRVVDRCRIYTDGPVVLWPMGRVA